MKNPLLLFLLLIAGQMAAKAQSNPDSAGKAVLQNLPEGQAREMPAEKKVKSFSTTSLNQRARGQIRQLKEGVLLVRLRTSDIALKNLAQTGNLQMVATLERQQRAANQRLAYAFSRQFTFCPVYFFYSSDTDKLRQGATGGFFLTPDLKPDNSIILPDTNFFIAELTDLEQFRENPDSPQASNNAEVSFKALVIRDRNFHQLANPFPFYIKAASNFPPRKRSEAEMVDLLNARLVSFYKQATFGKARGR